VIELKRNYNTLTSCVACGIHEQVVFGGETDRESGASPVLTSGETGSEIPSCLFMVLFAFYHFLMLQ